MAVLRKFLIVDDDLNGRFLISRTLLRHYPDAMVQECQDLNTAIEVVRSLPANDHQTVIVANRTSQAAGKEVVAALRAAHASIPIVWTGEFGQEPEARAAGATRFLDKMAWLMIGQVVADLS